MVNFFIHSLSKFSYKQRKMIQKKINSIVFLLLPLQVPKSRQCSAALQKCNSSLNSSSFQMSPTRSSTIFPFKHTYSTTPRGHSTSTTYLCSLCIKVCFIGQKEFSQRLASYFVFSCVHQQGYLGLQAFCGSQYIEHSS